MAFKTEVFSEQDLPERAAAWIAAELERSASFVVTGGTTAERVYKGLARHDVAWGGIEVLFSDERCVPPNDPASNFGMIDRLLFSTTAPKEIHRMRGEDEPPEAATSYGEEIRPVVEAGIDLVYLGMGGDAHVGAMFPGSLALDTTAELCVPVDRPDGMEGLTLTPPAMLSGRKVVLVVGGAGKAEAVARVINGAETPAQCPARILAQHPDVTFLLDEAAAKNL